MNGFRGLVFAYLVVSTLNFASSMSTKKAMMNHESTKGAGKQQDVPRGNNMQSTMSPSSAPSEEDEDESTENESMEAAQMGESGNNCTMSSMDMGAKKGMANGDMKGGGTASSMKNMKSKGDMGMTKANCTAQQMGGMGKGGWNSMMMTTMMTKEKNKMSSTMATPRGRRNCKPFSKCTVDDESLLDDYTIRQEIQI
ncbi:hypothetical protein MRX96_057056 [Rhipicephalus microplus]